MPKNPNHPARLQELANRERNSRVLLARAQARRDRKAHIGAKGEADRRIIRRTRFTVPLPPWSGRRREVQRERVFHATKGWREYRVPQ